MSSFWLRPSETVTPGYQKSSCVIKKSLWRYSQIPESLSLLSGAGCRTTRTTRPNGNCFFFLFLTGFVWCLILFSVLRICRFVDLRNEAAITTKINPNGYFCNVFQGPSGEQGPRGEAGAKGDKVRDYPKKKGPNIKAFYVNLSNVFTMSNISIRLSWVGKIKSRVLVLKELVTEPWW